MAFLDSKQVVLIKALIAARDFLLEDLKRISQGIDQAIGLTDFTSKLEDMKKFGSVDDEVAKLSGMQQNGVEVFTSFLAVDYLHFIVCSFHDYLLFLLLCRKQMMQMILEVMICLAP